MIMLSSFTVNVQDEYTNIVINDHARKNLKSEENKQML